MVYTKARLEHALKVFAPDRKLRGLKDTYLDRHLNCELRKTTKTSRSRNCQSWAFAEVRHDSDGDEYSPGEDRRRFAARRKKPLKRKSTEVIAEEKIVKKRKGEELLRSDGNLGFVKLKLTTQKGRDKLDELSRGPKINLEFSDHISAGSKREPSDWRSSTGGRRKRVRSRFDWMLEDPSMDSDDAMGMKENVSDAHSDHKALARTALRSGRVLEKDNDNSIFTPLPEKVDSPIKIRQHSPAIPSTTHRSVNSIGNSFNQPIEINTSEDDERTTISKRIDRIEDSMPSTQIKTEREPIRLNSTHTRSVTPRPRDRFSQFRYEPERISFRTSFIHPINFTLIPGRNQGPQCDFCTDWTMGILGHPEMVAFVVRDPRDPTRFTIENGPGADGRPPTQMCVKCSLDRLFIMRCHSPEHQPATRWPTNKLIPAFTKIREEKLNKEQLRSYLAHLFPDRKALGFKPDKKGFLPSCSLCPHAASWKCCKWQDQDRIRRPCRVPDLKQPETAAAASASSSAVYEKSSSIAHLTPSGSSTSHHQRTKPEVISLLDSSDEELDPFSKPATPSSAATVSLPQATNPQTNPLVNSPPKASSGPTSTSTAPTLLLQPPIQGCGLNLCTSCHTHLTQTSTPSGLLTKQVLNHLRGRKLSSRADVDWLFSGSFFGENLLERGVREGGRGR